MPLSQGRYRKEQEIFKKLKRFLIDGGRGQSGLHLNLHGCLACQVSSVMSDSLQPCGPYSLQGSSVHGILQA